MRTLIIGLSFLVLVGVGFYASLRPMPPSPSRAPVASVALPLPAVPTPLVTPMKDKYPKHISRRARPSVEFDPHLKYPPGTYVPRGFMPDFRQRIVQDFDDTITRVLGPDFPADKRAIVAKAQNDLWDVHGPNADLFRDGEISQAEFAERTHLAFDKFADDLGKAFTDEEYEKVLNIKKGDDPYYVLFHSAGEQPGLAFQNDPRPNGAPSTMQVRPDPTPPRPSPLALQLHGDTPPPSSPAAPAPGEGKYVLK